MPSSEKDDFSWTQNPGRKQYHDAGDEIWIKLLKNERANFTAFQDIPRIQIPNKIRYSFYYG